MDLHFATEKVASLKDAGLRYLVIVAGILTAALLNQWVESRQHAHQGTQALAAINAELARNAVVLDNALKSLALQRAQFDAAEALLGKESFATPDIAARAAALVKDDKINLDFGLTLAALQHSAWDMAVASQSLQYVAQDEAIRLARVYAGIQEVSNASRQIVVTGSTFDRASAVDAYIRHESKDALRFARAIRDHGIVLDTVTKQYTFLRDALRQLVPAQAGAPAASSAGASPVRR